MFDFYYRNRLHRALSWIEVKKGEYLILAVDYFANNVYLNSSTIPEIYLDYIAENTIPLIHEEYTSELKLTSDIAEIENIIPENVPFEYLLNKYLFLKSLPFENNYYEEKLLDQLKLNILPQLEHKKSLDGSSKTYQLKAKEVEKLIKEYGLEFLKDYVKFLRVKSYEKMSFVELIREKKILEYAISRNDCSSPCLPTKDPKDLRDYHLAISVLLEFKEDIYLGELLGIFREPLEINPYNTNFYEYENSLKHRTIFQICPCAMDLYNTPYYENLKMDTGFIKGEVAEIHRDDFELLSYHLLDLIEELLEELSELESKVLTQNLNKALIHYDKTGFISYFVKKLYSRIEK